MGAGDPSHIVRLFDADKASKVRDILPIGPPGISIGDIGEPFDLRRKLRQSLKGSIVENVAAGDRHDLVLLPFRC